MAISAWLKPPRRVLLLLVGVTVILGAVLGWLGWRLLAQDRALESQRLRGQLEDGADRVAARLRLALDATRDSLRRMASLADGARRARATRFAAGLGEHAILVLLGPGGPEILSARDLPFLPDVQATPEPPAAPFARAESLEFRARDYSGAALALRPLTSSPDPRVRAGAMLRLARALRKAGRPDSALAAYGRLARLGAVPIQGLPAELLGRSSRLGLLEEAGRTPELRAEADSVYAALLGGRWQVSHAAYEFYAGTVRALVDPVRAERLDSASRPAMELAAGASALWSLWRDAGPADRAGGERTVPAGSRAAFVQWRGSGGSAVGLVIRPEHVLEVWLGPLAAQLDQERTRIALADAEGNALARFAGAPRPQALRTPDETGLPWTLRVASADPDAMREQIAGRRRLVVLGVGIAGLIVLLGLYAVTRAVARELEVARLKSDFVSAVSHEFRTPLTSLRQLAEMLADGRVSSEERRVTYYDTIRRESERLQRLVEALLDFGRMEAGALEFRREPLDSASLVTELVGEFQREVEGRGYAIALRAGNGDCRVRADREALHRAIWNLLDNAVKYSPDHRTVTVSVGRDGGRVAIRVRDQGVGIPVDEQARMFEKFVRGSASDVRGVKGTGIGLAMVRHIVDAHDGRIEVESAPGVGSTFTILLPADLPT